MVPARPKPNPNYRQWYWHSLNLTPTIGEDHWLGRTEMLHRTLTLILVTLMMILIPVTLMTLMSDPEWTLMTLSGP